MTSFGDALKLAPVLALALLAIGTSLQVGCSGKLVGAGGNDAATYDDATTEDVEGGCKYGYGYGYSPHGYGCEGTYGYGH